MKSIYLIGSLRNKNIPKIANEIAAQGFEVFSDWFAPGPAADSYWKKHAIARGQNYAEALKGWAGKHVFEFDRFHIDRCDMAIMVMKAGKSAHLELGYILGKGKKGFILFESEPARWDVMYQFASGIFFSKKDLFKQLKKEK